MVVRAKGSEELEYILESSENDLRRNGSNWLH